MSELLSDSLQHLVASSTANSVSHTSRRPNPQLTSLVAELETREITPNDYELLQELDRISHVAVIASSSIAQPYSIQSDEPAGIPHPPSHSPSRPRQPHGHRRKKRESVVQMKQETSFPTLEITGLSTTSSTTTSATSLTPALVRLPRIRAKRSGKPSIEPTSSCHKNSKMEPLGLFAQGIGLGFFQNGSMICFQK